MNKYERIEVFEESMALCGSNARLKDAIHRSCRDQEIVWQEDELELPCGDSDREPEIFISEKRTMEAAEPYAKRGQKVCVLNFASYVQPGGGVTKGASSQEESLCRISTLYPALKDEESAGEFYKLHWDLVRRDQETGNTRRIRMNRDDCIYTPGVIVFRKDTHQCELMDESDWFETDVITCAAPDLRNSFGLIDDEEELERRIQKRIEKIFALAAEKEVEVLILGAFGCGVFVNPPFMVAKAFENVIAQGGANFKVIEFALNHNSAGSENYEAFSRIAGIKEEKKNNREYITVAGNTVEAVFFHRPEEPNGYLSNWYLAPMTIDGILFSSMEQFIMYKKCIAFGDEDSAQKVLATDDTRRQKSIGRSVNGYISDMWDGMRQTVAIHGLLAKFSQNEELKQKLLDTGNAYLVECARTDQVWACGRRLDDERRYDVSQWDGKNLLGFALMEVRSMLKRD